jgi:hypothetical protein
MQVRLRWLVTLASTASHEAKLTAYQSSLHQPEHLQLTDTFDTMAILAGVEYPAILRKGGDFYRFIGSAYVPDSTDGKMVQICKQRRQQLEQFEIR